MGSAAVQTCFVCGDPISPEARTVVVEHDAERETSLAHEPQLADNPHALLAHAGCARDLIHQRPTTPNYHPPAP